MMAMYSSDGMMARLRNQDWALVPNEQINGVFGMMQGGFVKRKL
jgi:hypothetical protein